MILTVILLIVLANLAGTVFLILRKPRIAGGVVSPKPEGHHRICAKCGLEVARYRPQEDGSVVCLNCKPLEG